MIRHRPFRPVDGPSGTSLTQPWPFPVPRNGCYAAQKAGGRDRRGLWGSQNNLLATDAICRDSM